MIYSQMTQKLKFEAIGKADTIYVMNLFLTMAGKGRWQDFCHSQRMLYSPNSAFPL